MNTLELADTLTRVAEKEGLDLIAGIIDVNFINIVSTKSGKPFGTMHTAVIHPETWKCYTEFPETMLYLVKRAAPVFGNSKAEWPGGGLEGKSYFEVDTGYVIEEETVTLKSGEILKGYKVVPPVIIGEKRNGNYDLMRQEADRGGIYLWKPGDEIKLIHKRDIKKES
ncbi:hypothetical protein lacNasYZ03_11440 [Lactobacillus nasalidis]|uniref:Uncharacterized protein n=1 Tax=Lactobacillus nasalidis TaxID=2797258 RepID=A0ABQ3W9A8_9LACO|nr:hypothetical protein [Lactobacillus nasalidis]GHV97868.1 hypothetical protein lacNasYZ01_10500 [Lactobacillus nasalidis]GHW00098.1 hypothetical protein lacNasYZ02_15270 [Lactobacillus nasalidis]GHW01457.1 hypothetical protein lacNasYZ03_11440 [Lactobacillus nasalidis]